MSARRPRPTPERTAKAISRRRFVGLLAAGSAAVIARPTDAAPAPRRAKRPAAPIAPAPSAEQKEFERQRANTLSTVKTLRAYKLPPGGDLSVVFRPLSSPRRSR
jgi:hypothetical protein